jgi:hypothetical protein
MSRELHREVRDFLSGYGAEDIHMSYGGKHPRFTFYFRGRFYTRIISGTSSDRRALQNQLADLKRELGPPIEYVEPIRRKLEDMMPSMIEEPVMQALSSGDDRYIVSGENSYSVQVGCYNNQGRIQVNLIVPKELAERFDNGRYSLSSVDAVNWRVTRATEHQRGSLFRKLGKKGDRYLLLGNADPSKGGALFGITDAEAIFVDDDLLITLKGEPAPLSVRMSSAGAKAHKVKAKPIPVYPVVVPSQEAAVPTDWGIGPITIITPENRMRSVLVSIRELESASPYRLKKVKDGEDSKWAWVAPMID